MSRFIPHSWPGAAGRICAALLYAAALLLPAAASAAPAPPSAAVDDDLTRIAATAAPNARIPVIVESASGASSTFGLEQNAQRASRAADAVRRAGAAVRGHLPLVGAVAAELTSAQLRQVGADPGISHLSFDRVVRASAVGAAESAGTTTPITFPQTIGAPTAWASGLTGRGVGVAVLDSGIADASAFGKRVLRRVDLVVPASPHVDDAGGHGTHVAGVIGASLPSFSGVAPEANLVSVRVLDANGNGRMSTVIRGLGWTVLHSRQFGIRVALLAVSGPVAGSYRTDPLAAAVEFTWQAGLVVVVAAGNEGPAAGSMGNPAIDPYVLAVGAADEQTTPSVADDTLAWFSSRGPTSDGIARPDLVAPGRKIVSLRVPGSTLDRELPTHREGERFFRLSGTSEAAAVVAGSAAVLLQQRPDLTPNAVKALFKRGARPLAGIDASAQGAGELDVARSVALATPSRADSRQVFQPADGFVRAVLPLSRDGLSWDGLSWDGLSWDGLSWDGLSWDGLSWDGLSWDGLSWDGLSWDGLSWDGLSWDTRTALD